MRQTQAVFGTGRLPYATSALARTALHGHGGYFASRPPALQRDERYNGSSTTPSRGSNRIHDRALKRPNMFQLHRSGRCAGRDCGDQIGWSHKVSEEEMMRTTSTKRPECHCKVPPIDRHPLRSDPAEERKAGCPISGGTS